MPSAVLGELSEIPVAVSRSDNDKYRDGFLGEKLMTGCKEEDTPPYSLLHSSSLPRFLPVAPFASFGVSCK